MRQIRNVFVVKADAHDLAGKLRTLGFRPRVYQRTARAENLSIYVWIVVADAEGDPS